MSSCIARRRWETVRPPLSFGTYQYKSSYFKCLLIVLINAKVGALLVLFLLRIGCLICLADSLTLNVAV